MYISFVRLHLEHAVQFWSPHHTKDIAKLEAVQRRTTKMMPSLRNKSYKERLALLNLFSLTNHSLPRKPTEWFEILKGFTNVDANKLFLINDLSRTRSNWLKLICKQIQLHCTKFYFTINIVREWNTPSLSVVQCNTIDSFKTNLTTISSNKVYDKGYMTRRTACCLTTLTDVYVCFWLCLPW